MKERPILFSAPMVRAIIEGRKTQTRRVVKPQPQYEGLHHYGSGYWSDPGQSGQEYQRCPYGVVGDRLWVRETWQAWTEFNDTAPNDLPDKMRQRINYPADGNTWDAVKRNAMYMPRWASRITLEITDVRVQRLQQISEEDVRAEGIFVHQKCVDVTPPETMKGYRRALFMQLWDSINGKTAPWDSNPWVWAISFQVVQP